MIGISLGWDPRKTELELPPCCDPDNIPLPRDASGEPMYMPKVVSDFKACMGVPRHANNCMAFINEALQPVARRHDNLLDMVAEVTDEDPFVALCLLQVCGVNRFGHILSAVPPNATAAFLQRERYNYCGCPRSDTGHPGRPIPVHARTSGGGGRGGVALPAELCLCELPRSILPSGKSSYCQVGLDGRNYNHPRGYTSGGSCSC
jgi:hypothetical protein